VHDQTKAFGDAFNQALGGQLSGEIHLRRVLKSYADYYNSMRTHRSLRMLRSLAKFSESEASNHTPFLADFTTTTPELKFSVHTGRDVTIETRFSVLK
jgi:hypothetical protein